MASIFTIISSIIGASLGSFAGVIIHRTRHQKNGILFGRSQCPNCKNILKALHLIPIISWLIQKGQCAFCKKNISSHYPTLEIFFGLTFAITYQTFPFHLNPNLLGAFIFHASILSLLLLIFFYDLIYKEIPDRFSLTTIALIIIAKLYNPQLLPEPSSMLIGMFIVGGFFLLQFIISKGTWIGGGDIRLGAIMGLLLGYPKGLSALIIAYLIGGFIGILLLIKGKVKGKTEIAFGPFLIISTIINLIWGQEIIQWYLNTLII